MDRLLPALLSLLIVMQAFGAPGYKHSPNPGSPSYAGTDHGGNRADAVGTPRPAGIYVLDDNANEKPASTVYAAGLVTSPGYLNDVTGHAIFVPIAKLLPGVTTWGQFHWDWGYFDTLVNIAIAHNKKFSIELETGYQSGSTYLDALPSGFRSLVDTNSAPLFDVWTIGGSTARGISAYIPLPWVPRIQEFWDSAAAALAAHFQQTGVYGSLTLVHVPGLSVYDEELRLPTGYPRPSTSDTLACPDGRPAYPTVITDADTGRWRKLGYSDSAVINGFAAIVASFARAFPDKFLGLSLLNPGGKGIDFPNLTGDTVGQVAAQIVKAVNAIAPGRVQLQADFLDINAILPEVLTLADLYADSVGWQSNKHAGTGAGCNGSGPGSCLPDGPTGPYFQLLEYGAGNRGEYVEVWSPDVVNFPLSLDAAKSAGLYGLTDVPVANQSIPVKYALEQNYPNPFNPTTMIRFQVPTAGAMKLFVYDILGREVATLVNETRSPGSYEVSFDGSGLASGVYIYRLTARQFTESRKMVLTK